VADTPEERTQALRPRRGPDPIALAVGAASLAVAVIAFVGVVPAVAIDLRWLLAAAAIALGVLLLGSSLRRRR
jgi:hypothetical protein